jgi:hypothetical protein
VDANNSSPNLRISAFIDPNDEKLSVIIINTSTTTDMTLALSFTGFTVIDGNVWRSTSTQNCVLIGSFNPANQLSLPANSITTLALSSLAPDTTPPANPTGLTATAGDSQVSLNWNDNSEIDLAGYNVYRSTTQGGGYAKVNGSLLTSPNYADSNLTNGTPYYYVVTAVDLAGHESTSSSEASAIPDYQNCAESLADGARLPADLAGTGDCYVTFADFAVLAGHWLDDTCTGPGNCDGADFEPNGSVDIFDLSEFADEWLLCNDPMNPDCSPMTF